MSEIVRLCAMYELAVIVALSGIEGDGIIVDDREARNGDIITYVAAIESQRDVLLELCEQALDWHGLDGDGISDPVLSQLRAAIDAARE